MSIFNEIIHIIVVTHTNKLVALYEEWSLPGFFKRPTESVMKGYEMEPMVYLPYLPNCFFIVRTPCPEKVSVLGRFDRKCTPHLASCSTTL